jgi:hypothetical protein
MKLTIRERTQKVLQLLSSQPNLSLRGIAQAIGMSKSSVHRHQQTSSRRNQHPESQLWETPAGAAWLERLVFATLFVFSCQGGIGCERIAEFFRLLRIEQHIGVSVASVRRIRAQMESQIIAYGQAQSQQMKASAPTIEICASTDETFFEQVVLVMMDLASGFIVMESLTQDCRYQTWQQQAQQAFSQLGLKVRYCVSDRAKALIKLALEEMGCPSIADLFHVMRELSGGIGRELSKRLFQINRRLEQLSEPGEESHLKTQLQAQQTVLTLAQKQYHECLHQISLTLHPWQVESGVPKTTPQVAALLQEHCQTLHQLKQTNNLPDHEGSIVKVERQIQNLSSLVDLWWEWVRQSLQQQSCDATLQVWLEQFLLPLYYWQYQVQRTKKPLLKTAYQSAYQQAQVACAQHPLPLVLEPSQLEHWQRWAMDIVRKFQRASSAVEGRNGYLSQIHRNRCGLSSRQLQVLTTLHNFSLKRADGTTAAQRLFGQLPPDLFESLVQQMPALPQARQRKATAISKALAIQAVPA